MPEVPILPWENVRALERTQTCIWTSKTLAARVGAELPFRIVDSDDTPETGVSRLIVLGGGTLIDRAKFWRAERSPQTWLLAIPSIWGSGAEASQVAVRTENDKKVPHVGMQFQPDARAIWPELAALVPACRARWGCGDTWSHALEGFLSPLSSPELREEIAGFIRKQLLPAPFQAMPEWFELSATACALQAKTGVGLIHGIAHEIEPRLPGFGHARLCSTLLWPVLSFNFSRGPKVSDLFAAAGLDAGAIRSRCKALHDEADFAAISPLLAANWPQVLRNPLSRINCAVVRPDSLSWFIDKEFSR